MYRYEFIATNGVRSSCNVYTLHNGKVKYIGFEDINDGMSVTNATKFLATTLVYMNRWDSNDCLFFEWYANHKDDEGTVDEITYIWRENEALDPKWRVFCDLKDNPFKEEKNIK